ncbi:MAG: phage tail tape measure protein [Pseudomonadaceae bacterium]|nr:phage tail tape measure protein [Pseudomonadaceae bacterium]
MAASKLQLQVILSALDKATAPLKRIQGGSIGAAKALKETRDRLKDLNAQQKDVSAWRTQRAAAEQTEQALGAARDKVKQLSRDIAASGAPTRQMSRDFKAAVREATALKQAHSNQQTQLQGLRNKLNAAGISTRNLGAGERDLRAKIAATNSALQQQENRLKRITTQQKRLAAAKSQYEKTQGLAGSMAGSGAGAVATGAAVGAPVLGAAKSYMAFEDAMLGVAKQVDGARDGNGKLTATYYEIGDAIKAMGERIPMATTELAALVEGGARMGIQGKDNLLKFAEVAANAATAFELPADQLGEDLARISNLYKLPIKDINQLGDAINYLDDNAQSKGADIIDVMQRTAGITASVGMSFKDAAALGSTFLTLGASAEVASSATNAMIRELAIATQQPKRFQKGLQALGLEAEAIQSGMAKNATGTLQQVLDTINKLPKDQQLSVTTQLFGKEFGDDAAKLAANIEEYRRQLDLANSDKGSGSMQREADIRAEALSARLEMAQNRLFNLGSSLGETLRPTLVGLLEGFNNIVASISTWVKANPELTGQIVKTAAGLALLMTAGGAIALTLASILGPIAMVRYAMALFAIKGGGLAGTLFNLGKTALPMVATGLRILGAAAVANPIGAIIMAIALGAALIYANWGTVGPYFLGLWAEIKAGFAGGLGGIAALIVNFSPAGLFYRAFAGVMGYFGIELPAKFTEFGSMIMQGLVNGIANAAGAVKAAVVGAADSSINYFKEKLGIHSPSRVFASLGVDTMDGLAQGLNSGSANPFAALDDTAQQVIKKGSEISANNPFAGLAGMPEMANTEQLTFDKRPPISAASNSAPAGAAPITINVYGAPGQDANAIAQAVAQALAQQQRANQAQQRGRLSDLE